MTFFYLFKCNTCLLIFFNCFAGFSQESQTRYYLPVNYCLGTRHMVKVCNSTAVVSKIQSALKFCFNFFANPNCSFLAETCKTFQLLTFILLLFLDIVSYIQMYKQLRTWTYGFLSELHHKLNLQSTSYEKFPPRT